MTTGTTAPTAPRPAPRGLVAILVALAVAVAWFAGRKHVYLTDFSLATYTEYFWPRRWGLVLHLLSGGVAITTGLVQLWLGLTGRTGPLHRALGRVYVGSIAAGSVSAFYVALTIPPGTLAYQVGLFFLGVAWVVTTGMALLAIRRRQIAQHRDWMVRSYVVTFAFVTFRLVSAVLRAWLDAPAGLVADEIDTLLAWACWAVPLLLAEPLIQWRALRRRAA